jgi:hypothetical protein
MERFGFSWFVVPSVGRGSFGQAAAEIEVLGLRGVLAFSLLVTQGQASGGGRRFSVSSKRSLFNNPVNRTGDSWVIPEEGSANLFRRRAAGYHHVGRLKPSIPWWHLLPLIKHFVGCLSG